MSGARVSVLAGPIDISTGHCLRCGRMTDAGPSERPPTVRGRRPLGWQSLPRFSFACSLKILVLDLDLQDKAIVFSPFPPSDRSRGSDACTRDGIAAVAPNSAMMRIRFSISPHSHGYSAKRRSISLRKNNNNVIGCKFVRSVPRPARRKATLSDRCLQEDSMAVRPGGLVLGVQETCHHLWSGGRQLANIVFANIGGGTIFDATGSRYKWQPAGQLLLSAATVGEKKNFVWEIPDVDLAQQITCVLGSRITGDEYLSRLSESKIESGNKGRHCVRV